jgi:hypothetical protein
MNKVRTIVVLILEKCQVWTQVYIRGYITLLGGYQTDEFFNRT